MCKQQAAILVKGHKNSLEVCAHAWQHSNTHAAALLPELTTLLGVSAHFTLLLCSGHSLHLRRTMLC